MKYSEHPILGNDEERETVTIYYENQPIKAQSGDPVAVALMNAGIKGFRKTRKKKEKRGVYCAIGRCTDCMMTINGIPNVRTCITPVEDGMRIDGGKWDSNEGGDGK